MEAEQRLVAPVGSGRLDELLASQPLETPSTPARSAASTSEVDAPARELGADDRCQLEQAALVGRHALNLAGEQRLDRRRHSTASTSIAISQRSPGASMIPSSTSMRTSSRTKSGLPSVDWASGRPAPQAGGRRRAAGPPAHGWPSRQTLEEITVASHAPRLG